MEILNTYGGIIIIYFLFQVLLPTIYGRLFEHPSYFDKRKWITKKQWIMIMIPVFGVLYVIFLIFKIAIKD